MPETSASPERKRRKSADRADPVAPELAGACSERLVQCLATGRTPLHKRRTMVGMTLNLKHGDTVLMKNNKFPVVYKTKT